MSPGAPIEPPDLEAMARSAFVYNRAHQRLGTYLVAWDRSGVTTGLDWQEGRFGTGSRWPHGALASLLDHSCALSVVLGLASNDGVAGTADLRIDYLWHGRERSLLHARGEWVTLDSPGAMACARSAVYHPGEPGQPLAVATSVVALRRGGAT